jgi:hypothetical protein
MKYFLLLFFIFFIACNTKPKYPDGGFEYPKNVVLNDTNLYYYQLKNIESQKEAFYDIYNYLFYRPFNEPNLSIKPQQKETFRLTYSTAFGSAVIIIFNEDSLTVKKGTPSILYITDTSRLSEVEKFHLRLLQRRFPIDTAGKPYFLKHYLDSLVKLYPELLDPVYYHKLYDETIAYSKEKFSPSVTKIPLTKQQYLSVVEQINSSGFWTMQYRIECEDPPMDGDGFTLEANTKRKYKIVSAIGCPDDTTKFTKACQRIIELAKMDKEINLVWSGKTIAVDSVDLPDIKEK